MALSKQDFDKLTSIIKKHSGIVIQNDKEYLLESRLMPITQKYNLGHLSDLVNYMLHTKDQDLLVEVIESMTTNESLFFRDTKPFTILYKNIIPKLFMRYPDRKEFKIWSAASSTGQEAYSIAMTILEHVDCGDRKIEILGTDINSHVISRAKKGIYSQFEVQRGVSNYLLNKYFTKIDDQWQINDIVKDMANFDQYNLVNPQKDLGKFDIIFCRNVLIYFDDITKQQVLDMLAKSLHPNGILATGSAEGLIDIENSFRPIDGLTSFFQL